MKAGAVVAACVRNIMRTYTVVILLIAVTMTATVCSKLPVVQVTMITNGQMY